jgi:hypothetical protein
MKKTLKPNLIIIYLKAILIQTNQTTSNIKNQFKSVYSNINHFTPNSRLTKINLIKLSFFKIDYFRRKTKKGKKKKGEGENKDSES